MKLVHVSTLYTCLDTFSCMSEWWGGGGAQALLFKRAALYNIQHTNISTKHKLLEK